MLYIKHNLVSIVKCDKIPINGSCTHCNRNICIEYAIFSRHHKDILPQYLESICSGCMIFLLASKKEAPNINEKPHLYSGKGIDQSPCKPIHLDLSSDDDSEKFQCMTKHL